MAGEEDIPRHSYFIPSCTKWKTRDMALCPMGIQGQL